MPAGGAAGGARRSEASPLARSSEAPSPGPTTRIRITDMATAIRLTGITIQPTATVIRPTVTAMDQGVPAMAMGQAPPVILKVTRAGNLNLYKCRAGNRRLLILQPRVVALMPGERARRARR